MSSRIIEVGIDWITRFPRAVLFIVTCLVIAAALGLPRFKLDASADSLTLERDADLTYFREMTKNYGSGDFLIITFTPKKDLFSDESLLLLRQLQDDLSQIEGVTSINSILNVPLLFSPKQSLREIAKEPRTLEAPNIDRGLAKREFLESPIYKEMILGPDGQTTALQLNIAVDNRYIDLVQRRDTLREKRNVGTLSETESAELDEVTKAFLDYRTASEAQGRDRVEAVREVVARYQDQAQIFVGGVSMITADMISFIQKDLIVFGAAAFLFIIVVLAIIFRTVRFIVIPLITCMTAVVLMLGLLGWLDWRVTVISSNFVALLLIISLSMVIHLIVRYREYAAEYPEWTQKELVSQTARYMIRPCLYTTLTTIVAFMSLVVSGIRPVIDFGWMMTIGLIFALVLTFVLLPACLMLLPRTQISGQSTDINKKESKPLTLYCSTFVEKQGKAVVVISILITLIGIYGLTKLQVENRFIDYFHENTEIHQGLLVIDNKLGGTTSFDIILKSRAIAKAGEEEASVLADEDDPFAEANHFDESDPFGELNLVEEEDPFADADPLSEHGNNVTSDWMTVAGLQFVERIHDYLETLPEVGKVQSLATLYKVGKEVNGSLNNFELAVMDKALTQDVRKVLVDPYLNGVDETRITMRVKDSYPNLQRMELVQRIQNDLESQFQLNMDHVRFSGLLVLYNNMLQSLFGSQIVTIGVVFLCIMMMFVVLFRSIVVAFVGIFPNILAALSILGGMALIGIPLDMMTITIAAITVGIGVDDTIHYIYRFKREVAVDGDYVAAMHRCHSSIGRAMYYTSIIIIFGFSIMVLSEFIPTIYFGLLTGLAMFLALLGALFLLPKMILLFKPFPVASPKIL